MTMPSANVVDDFLPQWVCLQCGYNYVVDFASWLAAFGRLMRNY